MISSIHNLWKEAISGRKIIQIEKEIAPQEQTKANHLAISQLKTKTENQPQEIKNPVDLPSQPTEQVRSEENYKSR